MKGKIIKHAYLIIAHDNFRILERLLMLVDDERNDIYIHIDKKVKDLNFNDIKRSVHKSNIYFIKNRIDVRWGHVSLLNVELLLFSEAAKKDIYGYYHLLSGVDLPLKNQNYIHNFFDEHQGYEFIEFSNEPPEDYESRIRHIHLFSRHFRSDCNNKVLINIRHFALKIQWAIKYDHIKNQLGTLRKGSNWVSLTDKTVRYLIEQTNKQIHLYKHSLCCDEIYKHTILHNMGKLCKIQQNGSRSMRKIDWKRGSPYTFKTEDFELLINSDNLFARKFNESTDFEIVEKIYNFVKNS